MRVVTRDEKWQEPTIVYFADIQMLEILRLEIKLLAGRSFNP